jgi:hypothetical protein
MLQLMTLTSTDSIYTERYMHTPQHNAAGYDNTSITDVQSLSKNVRFLIMHGIADDNVHMQNTLTLLDKLDLAGIENYDVHVFPDSDHSIYFHNANKIVYDSKKNVIRTDGLMLTMRRTCLVAYQRLQWRVASCRKCHTQVAHRRAIDRTIVQLHQAQGRLEARRGVWYICINHSRISLTWAMSGIGNATLSPNMYGVG